MIRFKKIKVILSVFLIGIVLGAAWHKLWLFPFPQLARWRYMQFEADQSQIATKKPEKPIIPTGHRTYFSSIYKKKTPFFSDRGYFDTIGDPRLGGLFVIQIPRHFSSDIVIRADAPLIIYRLITKSNDNTVFESWEKTDIPVSVTGVSCTHDSVVVKKFDAGMITLKSGGPVAASPILIKTDSKFIELLDFELIY